MLNTRMTLFISCLTKCDDICYLRHNSLLITLSDHSTRWQTGTLVNFQMLEIKIKNKTNKQRKKHRNYQTILHLTQQN